MAFEAGQYFHLNANSATAIVLSTTACTLGNVNLNTAGGSSNVCTIYDGITTAGTVVAVIDMTQVTSGSRLFAIMLKTGCCVVLNGGASAGDITIGIH